MPASTILAGSGMTPRAISKYFGDSLNWWYFSHRLTPAGNVAMFTPVSKLVAVMKFDVMNSPKFSSGKPSTRS